MGYGRLVCAASVFLGGRFLVASTTITAFDSGRLTAWERERELWSRNDRPRDIRQQQKGGREDGKDGGGVWEGTVAQMAPWHLNHQGGTKSCCT